MITKEQFSHVADSIKDEYVSVIPKMISYKTNIQESILTIATQQELEDVKAGKVNERMIDKLALLAHNEWSYHGDCTSLYCAAIAIATIIKEYNWGTQYLVGDELYSLAVRIYNA